MEKDQSKIQTTPLVELFKYQSSVRRTFVNGFLNCLNVPGVDMWGYSFKQSNSGNDSLEGLSKSRLKKLKQRYQDSIQRAQTNPSVPYSIKQARWRQFLNQKMRSKVQEIDVLLAQ